MELKKNEKERVHKPSENWIVSLYAASNCSSDSKLGKIAVQFDAQL